MKLRKLMAVMLTAAMSVGLLAGCGSTAPDAAGGAQQGATAEAGGAATEATGGADAAEGSEDLMKLEFFDTAANYQGDQTGWFAKVLADNCGVAINVIAPQVAGDEVYQTRASSGNLGDVLILENDQFQDCVKNGLVKDMSADLANYPNLSKFNDQITQLNASLEGNNGEIWGIPCQMMDTSPTAYSQDTIYSSPMLRWDLYKELGYPEMNNLEDLLDVLQQMQEAHPTNDAGDPCYPFSLWPDWDGGDNMLGIANVVQLTTWYNQKIKGSVILQPDGKFLPLTDKDAGYYRILHFLYEAQQRGLVDPDSGTQDWNAACAKMSAGQVYLFWYSWQIGFWNSTDRLKAGNAFIYVPVKDQTYYADGDTYYGSGRVWAVGSGVDDAKYAKIMELLDWLASPEGLEYQHDGIEGFNYEKNDHGTYNILNSNALMDNLTVPDEWGGGGYSDGNNAINQWICDAMCTDPNTGEMYNNQYWSSYKEETMTEMKKDWQQHFDAEEPAQYMQKNNILAISPNVSVSLPVDSSDISVIRNQCSEALNDYSWRMIFAGSDEEFDSMWDEMTEQLNGLEMEKLVENDTEKYTIELKAKNEAAGK